MGVLGRLGDRHIQDAKTKNADEANFLTLTDVEYPSEGDRNGMHRMVMFNRTSVTLKHTDMTV